MSVAPWLVLLGIFVFSVIISYLWSFCRPVIGQIDIVVHIENTLLEKFPDIKAEIEFIIAVASDTFKKEIRCGLCLKEILPWKIPENTELITPQEAFLLYHPDEDRNKPIHIGVSNKTLINPVGRKGSIAGFAFPGYNIAIVKTRSVYITTTSSRIVIDPKVFIHEVAHLMGAEHTDKPNSLMIPITNSSIPCVFDKKNKQIIKKWLDEKFAF